MKVWLCHQPSSSHSKSLNLFSCCYKTLIRAFLGENYWNSRQKAPCKTPAPCSWTWHQHPQWILFGMDSLGTDQALKRPHHDRRASLKHHNCTSFYPWVCPGGCTSLKAQLASLEAGFREEHGWFQQQESKASLKHKDCDTCLGQRSL